MNKDIEAKRDLLKELSIKSYGSTVSFHNEVKRLLALKETEESAINFMAKKYLGIE